MRSLYVEGNTLLHRMSAGVKLVALATFSILLFMSNNIALLAAGTCIAGLVYLSCGIPWRQVISGLRPVFLMICAIAIFHLIFTSANEAGIALFRLTALMLAAAAITATTSIATFMETITRAALPLERIGLLRAADVGLAIGLVIRFVPEISGRYAAIRDAHLARGVPVRITTMLVPLIISTLKDADAVADAIDARGFRGQNLSINTGPECNRTTGERT